MNKRRKTRQDNKLAAAQNGNYDDKWSVAEEKTLIKAVEDSAANWTVVAAAVGSRGEVQCESHYYNLKKKGRLDPIFETTPLREKIFTGFHKSAFKKCNTKIDGKKIATVGELAALDLGDIEYLKKLTKCKLPGQAVEMGTRWKGMAEEGLALWR